MTRTGHSRRPRYILSAGGGTDTYFYTYTNMRWGTCPRAPSPIVARCTSDLRHIDSSTVGLTRGGIQKEACRGLKQPRGPRPSPCRGAQACQDCRGDWEAHLRRGYHSRTPGGWYRRRHPPGAAGPLWWRNQIPVSDRGSHDPGHIYTPHLPKIHSLPSHRLRQKSTRTMGGGHVEGMLRGRNGRRTPPDSSER